jgi:nicotinamide-nucleotide amidase
MPVAEIIAIGTELLLGEIQDTNTRYLARILRDSGVNLYRTTMIGDNAERIAGVIRESLSRAQIVITTGGLGPTVDDPTRQAVALALGVDTEFRPELWDQIQSRFQRYGRMATDNNKRQAYIPQGAQAIENPVGTAPAFLYEIEDRVVISVPGVPREMEHLIEHTIMPYLRQRYDLKGLIKAKVFHTAGAGESQIDEWIGDLETIPNPTVGLLAHPGQVDVRVTAKADSVEEADRLIAEMSAVLQERLGDHIFGVDEETLESVTIRNLTSMGWKLNLVEAALGGELSARLCKADPETKTNILEQPLDSSDIKALFPVKSSNGTNYASLGASLTRGADKQTLHIVVVTPVESFDTVRSYGGPPPMAVAWAVNTTIDYLRRCIQPS